jgi:hypothetical protein
MERAWGQAIDRLGSALRTLEQVSSDRELLEVQRQCRRIANLARGSGLEEPTRLARSMGTRVDSVIGRGRRLSDRDLAALGSGYLCLSRATNAGASGSPSSAVNRSYARIRARLGGRR